MNLILDIGNSRVKTAWFDDNKLVDSEVHDIEVFKQRFDAVKTKHNLEYAGIGNVNEKEFDWLAFDKSVIVFRITSSTALPIINAYKSPETLGIDRISAAVAGATRFPDSPVLTIDIGTCITYDLVDDNRTYRGGGISPGYKMRLQAMHNFTKRLPLVEATTQFPMIGETTNTSLQFGAGRGIIAEIDGLVGLFRQHFPTLKVILTGGDHSMFEQHVENAIFAAPNLVLEGLHEILLHNISLND